MNSKLHKSKELNKIMKNKNSEYINITESLKIKGQPIVAGPVFYTKVIPEMLYLIFERYLFLYLAF